MMEKQFANVVLCALALFAVACRERESIEDFRENPILGLQVPAQLNLVATREMSFDAEVQLRWPAWALAELGVDAQVRDAVILDSAVSETRVAEARVEDVGAADAGVRSARMQAWLNFWSLWFSRNLPVLRDAPAALSLRVVDMSAFPRVTLAFATTNEIERRTHNVKVLLREQESVISVSVRGLPGELDTSFAVDGISDAVVPQQVSCYVQQFWVGRDESVGASLSCFDAIARRSYEVLRVSTHPGQEFRVPPSPRGFFSSTAFAAGEVSWCSGQSLLRTDAIGAASGILQGDTLIENPACEYIFSTSDERLVVSRPNARDETPAVVAYAPHGSVEPFSFPPIAWPPGPYLEPVQSVVFFSGNSERVIGAIGRNSRVQSGNVPSQVAFLQCSLRTLACEVLSRSENFDLRADGRVVPMEVRGVVPRVHELAPIFIGRTDQTPREYGIAIWSPGGSDGYIWRDAELEPRSPFFSELDQRLYVLAAREVGLQYVGRTLYRWDSTVQQREVAFTFEGDVTSIVYENTQHRVYAMSPEGRVRRYWL